jgi:D-methionine transport system ATP-binding protein
LNNKQDLPDTPPPVHIRIAGLGKRYEAHGQTVDALRDIALEIRRGEVFGIIGRSGAGKSSLLRIINRLEEPGSGEVFINGDNICQYAPRRLRQLRRKIAMIFQHFNLMNSKTVADNLALPLRLAGIGRAETESRITELLALVGLENRRNAYPAQLSGGQKQRVGIARALMLHPEILLCDEATSSLDPESTQSILALLRDINRRMGLTIVLITHEMEVIRGICDHVMVLDHGSIVEQGEVWQVFGHPAHEVTRALLGTLQHALPDNETGDHGILLDLHYTGVSGMEPDIAAITRALGATIKITAATIDRIQGRAIGTLRIGIHDTPLDTQQLIARAAQVADCVDIPHPQSD